jgi:hypothetical protein
VGCKHHKKRFGARRIDDRMPMGGWKSLDSMLQYLADSVQTSTGGTLRFIRFNIPIARRIIEGSSVASYKL